MRQRIIELATLAFLLAIAEVLYLSGHGDVALLELLLAGLLQALRAYFRSRP